jgi:hypothetical protein
MRTVNNAPSGPVLRGNDPHKRWLAKRAASIRVSSPILPIQFEISIMRHAMLPPQSTGLRACLKTRFGVPPLGGTAQKPRKGGTPNLQQRVSMVFFNQALSSRWLTSGARFCRRRRRAR